MSPPTISSVAEKLTELKAGYRAWFWFCPQLEEPYPSLLITPFQSDPDMTALRKQIDAIPTPPQAETCMGFVNMTKQGRLLFGSSILSRKMLERLAKWTKRHSSKHTSLRKLKNAVFLNVSSKGVVLDKIEEESLWDAIPDAIVSGTIAHAASSITKAKEGRDYWYYMCSDASGNCGLSLGSSKRDPDGTEFGTSVVDVQLRFPNANKHSQGIFRTLPSGKLAFLTVHNISMAASIVKQLLQKYPVELKSLQNVRIIHLKDGEFGKMIIVEHTPKTKSKNDLSHLESVLKIMDRNKEVYFWFAHESNILALEQTKESLKETAKKMGGAGTRGKLVMSKRGSLDFRVKKEAPNLLESLANFASNNVQDWPVLQKMNGAIVTHLNSSGEVISRQKKTTLWSFLTNATK